MSLSSEHQDYNRAVSLSNYKYKGGKPMETQTTSTDWLAKEEETFKTANTTFEQLPSLKLVPNEIVEIDIDFSVPFVKWPDEVNKTTKAIIPVMRNGVKHNWWLNIKNPTYAEVVRAGRTGQTHFKVLQTGTLKNTKYTLIK